MSSHKKPTRAEIIKHDIQDLLRLGYAQQLLRDMGGFSNFAVSFSIISILTGPVIMFGYGFKLAGPIANSVGWPLVSLLTLCVAASMAELASAYPTAGGLYFWAFRLGGRGWAWLTAWLNMIGQVAVTAAINMSAATYIIATVDRDYINGKEKHLTLQLAVMVLITIPQVLINLRGIKITARFNVLSAWWHIGGVLFVVISLVWFVEHHQPFDFLFNKKELGAVKLLDALSPPSEGPDILMRVSGHSRPLLRFSRVLTDLYDKPLPWLAFLLATLQAQWTFTGYDASAHAAEETVMARRSSAWGILMSLAVASILGYILLMTLTLSIPAGSPKAVQSDYAVLYIIRNNKLGGFLENVISIILCGAMWLAGTSSVNSMARMWYAFARDDGMPGSGLLKRISPRYRTPVWAIIVTSGLTIALSIPAHDILISLCSITLYLAYIIPVYLNFRNRLRGSGERVTTENAPWNLGRYSTFVNIVAMSWVAVITVIFCLPPNELTLWSMLLITVLLSAYWYIHARTRFLGPPQVDSESLKRADTAAVL